MRSGLLLATLPLRDVSMSQVIKGAAAGSAVVPLTDRVLRRDPFRATVQRRTCMWAERQEVEAGGRVVDSVIPWAGIVMRRTRKRAARSMALDLVTWESYWTRRVVGSRVFAQADRFVIMRQLATWAATQPDGVVMPHLAPTVAAGNLSGDLMDRTYDAASMKPILEAATQLGNAGDGFDWRLVPYRDTDAASTFRMRLDLGYPRLGRVAPADLLWSDDDNDTRSGQLLDYTLTEDGSAVDNTVTALGKGSGPTQMRSTISAAAVGRDEVGAYGYPVYEGTLGGSTSELETQDALDRHTRGAMLAGLASEVRLSGIEVRGDLAPTLGRYLVGDDGTFRLASSTTGQPVTVIGQIIGRTIKPAQPGRTERVTMDVQGTVAA
jgi:hypothetical protein